MHKIAKATVNSYFLMYHMNEVHVHCACARDSSDSFYPIVFIKKKKKENCFRY